MTTALLLLSRLAMADDAAGTPTSTEAPATPAPAEPAPAESAPAEPAPTSAATPAPASPEPAAMTLGPTVTTRTRGAFSVGVEGSTLATRDDAWAMFADTAALNAVGVRAGYALGEHLAATVAWQAGRPTPSQTEVDVMYTEDDGSMPMYGATYASTFKAHQVTAGVRYLDTERSGVRVYGGLDLAVMLADVTFDTDVDRDDPLGEVNRQSVAFGGVGTVGLRVPIQVDPKLVLAPYAEVGYGAYLPVRFDDLGALDFGGLAARGGIALDF